MNIGVILAGGSGTRMGSDIPKQFIDIYGKPLIIHTLESFDLNSEIDSIAVVCKDEWKEDLNIWIRQFGVNKVKWIISGGNTRQESTYRAIKALEDVCTDEDILIIHDAARPLVKVEDLNKLSLLAKNHVDGAMLAVKCADTLKKVIDGKVVTTVPRENIYRAYTPQMGKTKLLQKALNYANDNHLAITDDASALELIGCEVLIVEGSADNFKLTTPDDLKMAKILIEDIHV